jgi:hypothetical protein
VGSISILQPNLVANVARQSGSPQTFCPYLLLVLTVASLGGVAYLMPDPTFWNQTFVSTPTKNYTDLVPPAPSCSQQLTIHNRISRLCSLTAASLRRFRCTMTFVTSSRSRLRPLLR